MDRAENTVPVAVLLLLSDGMTYSIAACAAVGKHCAELTITLLLLKGRCLVTAGCCEYATIYDTDMKL
jgi:hypothetical protein